jgi:hypothetical protein
MTISRSEDLLVGLLALGLLPMIAMRVWRGLRQGRLPVYRTYFQREENETKFKFLLGLHMLSFVAVAAIAIDLLFDMKTAP